MIWLWLGIIIVAVVLDFVTSDFLFAGCGIGALVALILSAIDSSILIQIIVFAIISAIFIFTIYPKIKKKIAKDKLGTKTMEEEYIGRVITLDKDLDTEILMKFEGIYWTFKSDGEKINKGEAARIVAVRGNKLIIEKYQMDGGI